MAWATFSSDGSRPAGRELTRFRSSEEVLRGFCASCGTAITYQHRGRPEELDIALAALDEPAALAPECHIWVSHKVSWVVLGDGLPQFQEWRKGGA